MALESDLASALARVSAVLVLVLEEWVLELAAPWPTRHSSAELVSALPVSLALELASVESELAAQALAMEPALATEQALAE